MVVKQRDVDALLEQLPPQLHTVQTKHQRELAPPLPLLHM